MAREEVAPPRSHESLKQRGIRQEWATKGWNLRYCPRVFVACL